MAPLCLFYFTAFAACLGLAGHLADIALPARAPRRWLWLAVLAMSVVLPPLFSMGHSSSVLSVWGVELLRLPAVHAHGATGRNWLDCDAPYGLLMVPIGFLATLVLLAWSLLGAWRALRLTRAQRPTIVDDVPVVVTASFGPAAVGVWRSRVVLPGWVLALPADERRYVVRHEDEHRRARDAMLLAVAATLACLFPWNLALWWQLRRVRLAVELDCDRRVVRALGDAHAYGSLLLRVAEASSRGPGLRPALAGGAGMLERRIRALVGTRRRGLLAQVVAPVLAVLVLLAILSMPHPELARTPAAAIAESHHGVGR